MNFTIISNEEYAEYLKLKQFYHEIAFFTLYHFDDIDANALLESALEKVNSDWHLNQMPADRSDNFTEKE